MYIIIGLIACLFLMWISWDVRKDITAPPFVLSAVWSFVYITLLFRIDSLDKANPHYLLFFGALFFFSLGFSLFSDYAKLQKTDLVKNHLYEVKKVSKGFIVFLSFLLAYFLFIKIRLLFAENFYLNPFQTITEGIKQELLVQGLVLEYGRNFITALTVVLGALYFHNPSKRNKFPFFIILPISLFFVITAGDRGTIFFLIIGLFFTYMFFGVSDKKKRKRAVVNMILVLVLIFIITTYWKFVYVDQSNPKEFLGRFFNIYFTLSPMAFIDWMGKEHELLMGQNTFRFFHVISNAFGGEYIIKDPILDYTKIENDYTNTYTILRFYISDYGIVYALFIQFFLGAIYGMLYAKSFLKGKFLSQFQPRILLALLYFPLVYQFFDDRYLSLLSTWLQFIFWTWLFTKYLIKEIPYDRIK